MVDKLKRYIFGSIEEQRDSVPRLVVKEEVNEDHAQEMVSPKVVTVQHRRFMKLTLYVQFL